MAPRGPARGARGSRPNASIRGGGKHKARSKSTKRRRSLGSPSNGNGASQIHHEMLNEVIESRPSRASERPLKRRKIRDEVRGHKASDVEHSTSHDDFGPSDASPVVIDDQGTGYDDDSEVSSPSRRVFYNSATSTNDQQSDDEEADEEEELDWERILSKPKSVNAVNEPAEPQPAIALNLDDQSGSKPKRQVSSHPGTAADKRKRVDVHKLHVCTLLAHTYIRNAWCNDESLSPFFRGLLKKSTIELLNPSTDAKPFDQATRLDHGLRDAGLYWRGAFKVVGVGMRSSSWANSPEHMQHMKDLVEPPVDRAAFSEAAKRLRGSRDIGMQLFCALLRFVGVDARLVVSLQTLSFRTGPTLSKNTTPQKPAVHTTAISQQWYANLSGTDEDVDQEFEIGPRSIKRFGRGNTGRDGREIVDYGVRPEEPAVTPKRKRESPYPVFWVEVFNPAHQKWIPMDPFDPKTLDKPRKFEPPVNDTLNSMSYVIAFDEDGAARDVTRRYTKAYNAKTRRNRVEAATDDGSRWMRKALKLFRGPRKDRDAIEDAALSRNELQEPMPSNILDFKDHPTYSLERHLHRDEVIEPKNEVGKLAVGKTVETIYRRKDVLRLRTIEKWYRLGRELQQGSRPLKFVRRPRRFRRSSDHSDSEDEGLGLYSLGQTDTYVAPPVIGGKVPRNRYGNIDVYVPSMIPTGGVHIVASEGVAAARVLGIDMAEAVVGFKFKGREGKPVMRGVIVAREFREAMEETVAALGYQRERAAIVRRSAKALRGWKRLITGLTIAKDLVEQYGSVQDEEDMQRKMDEQETRDEASRAEGGFMRAEAANLGAEQAALSSTEPIGLSRDPIGPRKWFFEPTVTCPWDRPKVWQSQYQSNNRGDTNRPNAEAGPKAGPKDADSGGGFIVDDDGAGEGPSALPEGGPAINIDDLFEEKEPDAASVDGRTRRMVNELDVIFSQPMEATKEAVSADASAMTDGPSIADGPAPDEDVPAADDTVEATRTAVVDATPKPAEPDQTVDSDVEDADDIPFEDPNTDSEPDWVDDLTTL